MAQATLHSKSVVVLAKGNRDVPDPIIMDETVNARPTLFLVMSDLLGSVSSFQCEHARSMLHKRTSH